MDLSPATKPPAAIVDASFIVGYCAKEGNKYAAAKTKLEQYVNEGWELFAPNILAGEVLFVLCKKMQLNELNATEHAEAVLDFTDLMQGISMPVAGDTSLISRAEQIRAGFSAGCGRSSDSFYLALAEQLRIDRRIELVTFDIGMDSQAKATATGIVVEVLPVLRSTT